MNGPKSFVDLLYAEAPPEAFDEVINAAERSGASTEELARLRKQRTVALRVREQMARLRQREAEISALYETANDLAALREVDDVLRAIVHRAGRYIFTSGAVGQGVHLLASIASPPPHRQSSRRASSMWRRGSGG